MITLGDIEEILQRVKYKPSHEFTMDMQRQVKGYVLRLAIHAKLPDARDSKLPLADIFFSDQIELHPNHTQTQIISWRYDCVERMELHEAQEWFKVDRKHYHDPHPELEKRVI